MKFLICLFLLTPFASAHTNWTEEANVSFGRIPILHGGRSMPLVQYARLNLLQFSGKATFDRDSATRWLARLWFAPGSTRDEALFLVNNPEVLDAMGVERLQQFEGESKPSSRRFSFNHLRPGLQKLQEQAARAAGVEPDLRTVADKEFLRVWDGLMTYLHHTVLFSFARPDARLRVDEESLRQDLGLGDGDVELVSYLELMGHSELLLREFRSMDPHGDIDLEEMTPRQREALRLSATMFSMRKDSEREKLVHLFPAAPHGTAEWLTPMDALHAQPRDRQLIGAIETSAAIANAFIVGDMAQFVKQSDALEAFTTERMSRDRGVRLARTEADFHNKAPFRSAKIWYIVALVFSIFALFTRRWFVALLVWLPLLAGFGYHLTGLIWRVIITGRPPVTNLYGTFIFVGFVCVLLAMLLENWQRDRMGLFVGSLIGVGFLLIADRFAVEGDTMKKVVAVLASNFWLGTHVICITIGYAFCFISGVFGHIWLMQRACRIPEDRRRSVMLALDTTLGFGLAFAFLGTMLGGIWADQSWGRFWGWDPKENGALVLVLWTAAIYHARIAGLIAGKGTAICASLGCIVVALAWLGVNLLGVGLHNYGFTSTLFYGMVGFVSFELIYLAGVLLGGRGRA